LRAAAVTGAREYYFEDIEVGKVLETPAMTVTEAHVAMFTGLSEVRVTEPHAVHDLLPLCLSSGLGWRLPQPPLVILAFMGFDWTFLKPARVGDTIRSASKTVAKRLIKEGGVVIEERKILNQRGDVLQAGKLTLLVARRPAE
jgi:3-hydroxybutyryl-CoA dehydratase